MKLSKQALEILEQLKQKNGESTVTELEKEGFDQSMVNRASLELEQEGLAEVDEETDEYYVLTDTGKEVEEKGSPEYRLVERVRSGDTHMSDLQDLDLDVALGKARERSWIKIDSGEVELVEDVEQDPVREKLEEKDFTDEHLDRGLVEIRESTVRKIRLTEKGEDVETEKIEEDFNVEAEVETPRIGKKHFYKEILDFAQEKFVEMGFQEMTGDFIVPSFLNFDALYTAQDHPARDLHDTFFMKTPEKTDLSEYGEKVQHVKETHEDGWTTGSKGWGYDWSEQEASRNVLRTHTTAVSARRLHEIDINEEELPKKFFIIGRNFRNETVDRTHLPGFIQLDGIVVGKNLNYRNLKGYLSEFFEKMGYEEFRLIPSYYPYTEMSTEVQVYDEEDEEWLGMGGAGLFRPEVVKPMLGFEATVLAWGLGLGRVAMKAAEIEDIRELYRNDIEILEETPKWRPHNGGEQ
ncbi:phenylalanine--tRNA ligase subunit alpha [Candidatus Nanosalina sp. VS9-1]|uniref:phenylalanine--tRNA ligase subunit alpha n=1 Tax=Candidatus Nanosalina sp. VS9-1 TaxID=3388566 RepID=UPI0039DF45CE